MFKQYENMSREGGIDLKTGRFSGILSAIEFFSQRFELEQIVNYAFEFSQNLLLPDQIALWSLEDGQYTMKNTKGYQEGFVFEHLDQYDQIAYFHAGLLYDKNIATLLPIEISQVFQPDFCIPLIMDKSFFGLIALKRTKENPFTSEDEIFACALMNLFSTALTNYSSYKHLEKTKTQLDEKIFNLFAINHSTKALLSELSLNHLYDLAIGVFSELTQSSFTTFFIKDPIGENYQLIRYKNVREHHLKLEMLLFENQHEVSKLPIVIDMSQEVLRDLFINNFFNGQEIIDCINPLYVVLLQKSSLLVGFVTLGTKVNDTRYDNSIFELVESLASATYIAINNALYIDEINQQKKVINNKFNELIKLNDLMKNINSALTYDQVISLVMDTLQISFGLEMGFFALYNTETNAFTISNKVQMKNELQVIEMIPEWMPLLDGHAIVIYEADKVDKYMPKAIAETFMCDASGVVIIPVYIHQMHVKLIGVITLLSSKNKPLVTEELLVSYDAIATHIAPVIHQLQYAENIKNTYQPDYGNCFIEQLRKEVDEALDFSLNLFVVHICHQSQVHFKTVPIAESLKQQFEKCYATDHRNIFILTNKTTDVSSVDEQLSNAYDKKVYQLGIDFEDYESFLKLFEV